jgi:hypothetical protein
VFTAIQGIKPINKAGVEAGARTVRWDGVILDTTQQILADLAIRFSSFSTVEGELYRALHRPPVGVQTRAGVRDAMKTFSERLIAHHLERFRDQRVSVVLDKGRIYNDCVAILIATPDGVSMLLSLPHVDAFHDQRATGESLATALACIVAELNKHDVHVFFLR